MFANDIFHSVATAELKAASKDFVEFLKTFKKPASKEIKELCRR